MGELTSQGSKNYPRVNITGEQKLPESKHHKGAKITGE